MRDQGGQGTTWTFQLDVTPSSLRSTQLQVESQTPSTGSQLQASVFYDQAKPPQEVKLPFLLPIKGPSSTPLRSTASSKMENLSTPYNPADPLSQTVASSQASTSTAPPPQSLPPSSSVSNVADQQSNPPSTSAVPSNPDLQPLVIDPKNPKKQQSKMFRCTGFGDCQMTFTRSEHLARHVRKHTGERPFKCHCGRTFSRLDNVRQHASTVHADLVAENAKCIQDLVALHSTLSVTTMQKQKDSGMVLRDTEKEAAKAKRKAEAALKPKKSAGNPGRKKGTAAEKKAKEQAEAAEAQERRRKKEAKQQEQPQIKPETPLAGPSEIKTEDTPYRLSPVPAPASFSPYPNEQQFVPPAPSHPPPSQPSTQQQQPPHTTSMPYPSYNLAPHPSNPYPQGPSPYGMYSQPPPPSGMEHLYGFQSTAPPPHPSQHQQQDPPSPSTSAAFYPQPPPSQSPHLENSDPRDHDRNSSSSFHHDPNYPHHSSLGYPTSSMYPPDQNKVSLPSISALLPTPFSRPDSHGNGPSLSNEGTTEPQSQPSQPPIDAQAAYYATLNSTANYSRSAQYAYPSQMDYAQQQSQPQQQPQYASNQQPQATFPSYDQYGRPPSPGTQSERGDVPPSLSNGSSSTASSSFPADSPSNPPFQDQLGQPPLGQLNYPSFTGHYSTHPYFGTPSPWAAPPPGYNLGYPPQPSQPPPNQQQYPSMPSNYPVPQSYPHVAPKWGYSASSYGNTNYNAMQNQQQNDETAPRLTPLFPSPSQAQPQPQPHLQQSQPHPHNQSHSLSHSHSRDHSSRSSLNSPSWNAPLPGPGSSNLNGPVGGGYDHSHPQTSPNGMFATPTSLPKRERDEQGENFYAHKRRAMYGETPVHLHLHHHHQPSHPEQMQHGLTPIGGR
ncbi:hypothetical protein JCM3765_006363 [Sporobolomyces pararoseus]